MLPEKFSEKFCDLCVKKLVQVVVGEGVNRVVYDVEGGHCDLHQELLSGRKRIQISATEIRNKCNGSEGKINWGQ